MMTSEREQTEKRTSHKELNSDRIGIDFLLIELGCLEILKVVQNRRVFERFELIRAL
jgi:hypothetical protein